MTDGIANLSARAARVKEAAIAAFGERGLTQLAKAAGISKQMLSFIVTGAKPVSDDVYRKIAQALTAEAVRMRRAAGEIDETAKRMLSELT